MAAVPLRPYQQKLYDDIHTGWAAGHRNILAVSGTGSGKSVLMSNIVLTGYNQGMRQAITAHRNELVTQMSCHLAEQGIPHRIIGSKNTIAEANAAHREKFKQSFVHPNAATAVVGVDTLMARSAELADWAKQIHRWLGDEAHHTIGNDRVERNKWGKAVAMFCNAYGLGVTATPLRADGQGLGADYDGVFHHMVEGPSMRWLISNKYLSDYEIVCPLSDISKHIEEEKVGKDGDWSHQAGRRASKKSKIVGDVVQNYGAFAMGRRAIVFATDIETAKEMAEQFNAFGVRAAALDGTSDPTYRRHVLKQFRLGQISVLINVDLFDEGFDCPACDVVIMARPTASLGKYLQMVGRALRYMEGKVALIIDHVSNVIRHGLPDKHRIWTLARKDKRAKQIKDPNDIELTRCLGCLKPYEKFRTVCPYCSMEKPLPEPRSRSVEMVEGDLILLDRETLEKMRANTQLESASDVGKRVAAATRNPIAGKAGANRQIEKIEAQGQLKESFAQFAAIQRAKGYDDREIHKQIYLTLGMDILTALDASKTRKEFEEINKIVQAWYLQ